MKNLFILASCLFAFATVVNTQGTLDGEKILPGSVVQPNDCGFRINEFQTLLQFGRTDRPIVIISHLNKNENGRFGRRRLHNAKAYLTDSNFPRRWAPNFVVVAEGDRVPGIGYLDFFLDGDLAVRMLVGSNGDLYLGDCGSGTGDKPCSDPREKQFYPCKGKSKRS